MKEYLESGGEKGHIWNGVPTLLLTTTGHKTGRETTTPLIYGKSGWNYLLVASKGGAPEHPKWYLNLAKNPRVKLQVGTEHIDAQARTATTEEKPALWKEMTAVWPAYDQYQERTSREIPLIVLEPR
jgi:deazaflavin-dependent oxidoreductase (nitroreductase family)